mmetsp:Transcript_100235/g.169288  ORF Transcript_100235/g.169288 Transcript_100235/m.169288 type:complete len:111 (+) Transcript_100235:170-502(+)
MSTVPHQLPNMNAHCNGCVHGKAVAQTCACDQTDTKLSTLNFSEVPPISQWHHWDTEEVAGFNATQTSGTSTGGAMLTFPCIANETKLGAFGFFSRCQIQLDKWAPDASN